MKNIQLGNKELSAVALGTWAWGTGFNGSGMIFGTTYHSDDLKAVFQKGMKSGLYLWDTAAVYGNGTSERLLGSFLKDEPFSEKAVLSTKFTPHPLQTKNAMRRSLQGSLQRLGTNCADIYWIHNASNVERWTREIAHLAKEGSIGAIGVSNHTLDDIKRVSDILAKEGVRLAAVQNHYSLLYRKSEYSGILDWCQKNQVVFFSYMVLEQGVLTGKYSSANPFPKKSYRSRAFNSEKLSAITPLVKNMKEIGNHHSVGVTEVAVAWALAKGTVPIIGVTKEQHIDSVLNAADLLLSDNEIEKIENVAQSTGISVKTAWEPA